MHLNLYQCIGGRWKSSIYHNIDKVSIERWQRIFFLLGQRDLIFFCKINELQIKTFTQTPSSLVIPISKTPISVPVNSPWIDWDHNSFFDEGKIIRIDVTACNDKAGAYFKTYNKDLIYATKWWRWLCVPKVLSQEVTVL